MAAKERFRARLWALAIAVAICVAAPVTVAHARALGGAPVPENSPLGLARNSVTVDAQTDPLQVQKTLLESAFAYGDLASDDAYAKGLKGGKAAAGTDAIVGGETAAGSGLGRAISEGHAFDRHVLTKGEFKDFGITSRETFAKHIDDVVGGAKGADVRQLSGGRSAYWDEVSGTVVIRNPSAPDMGTAFRPTAGRKYFETLK